MALVSATPVFILLLGISLTGCALSPIPKHLNDVNSYANKHVESMTDITPGELLTYQQQSYQLQDPLGDHALLSLLQLTAPDVVWLTLTGTGYDQLFDDVNALRSEFEYRPTALDRFAGMKERKPQAYDSGYRNTWSKNNDVFTPVILQQQKQGVSPRTGVCHRWSAAYRNNPRAGIIPYLAFSKLFWALAYGESSVYFVTEREEQLAQWIIDQDIRSVTLQDVFSKSYQINSGDVYLSILTATNVFSRFWFVKDRENLSLATRLKLITAAQYGEQDNYGAWHHFWGMVLFGYCHGETSSRLVGWIESFGSHRLSRYDEADEDYINRHAGQAGVQLRQQVEQWPSKRTTASHTSG